MTTSPRPFRASLLPILCLLTAAGAGLTPVPAAAAQFTPASNLPGLGAGRIWSVAADPATSNRLLAGTDAGAYVSTDGGATWTLSLRGARVWTVGFDARNPDNAFAGTDGHGVFASGDAGATWTAASAGLPNRDVRTLAFGLDGIAAGTDDGVALSPDGRAWHSGGLLGVAVSALAVAANSPVLTLVAGADNGNLAGGYVFRGSAGGSWTPLSSGLPAGAVATSLSAGPIDAAVPKRPLLLATTKGLFRSGDSGNTWTPSGGVPVTLAVTTVAFDPLDPTVAYAGADAGGSTGGDLLRSTDGGQTFAAADAGLPQSSKNVEAIGFAPTNPLTVIAALDPPTGTARVWSEVDTSVPAPPQLVAEAPGAPVPTVVATPPPQPTSPPGHAASTVPAPSSPNPALQVLGNIVHWPQPLVYELIVLLLIVYVVIRWRQHYYVEGPP